MAGTDWRVTLDRVEFTDTATVLTFNYTTTAKNNRIRMTEGCFLSDEKGREYKALFLKEKDFGKWIKGRPEGVALSMGFEPLPKGTRVFDFVEGYGSGDFAMLGINGGHLRVRKPHYSRKERAALDAWRENFFTAGEATVSGVIEDYKYNEEEAPSLMVDNIFDGFVHSSMVAVDSLGRFSFSLDLEHPLSVILVFRNRYHTVLIEPGDSLSMIIHKGAQTEYLLSNGAEYKLKRLSPRLELDSLYPYYEYTVDCDSLSQEEFAERFSGYIDLGNTLAGYLVRTRNLTAFEYTYFKLCAANNLLAQYMDLRLDATRELRKQHPDSLLNTDSLLAPLRRFAADDPTNLALRSGWIPFNRFRFDPALNPTSTPIISCASSYRDKALRLARKDSALFGKRTLLGDVCIVRDSRRDMEIILDEARRRGTSPDSARFFVDAVKALIQAPAAKEKLEWIYNDVMQKQVPFYDLPECAGKEILKKILSRYPGKYVFLDFWSTSCGPCVAQIKSWNQYCPSELRPSADYVPVFITYDDSQRYETFVREHLKGCESLRLSRSDCMELWDMFDISGIPHHEIIAPDGKASRRAPDIHISPRYILNYILDLERQ